MNAKSATIPMTSISKYRDHAEHAKEYICAKNVVMSINAYQENLDNLVLSAILLGLQT